MSQIHFIDLERQQQRIRAEIDQAIASVLDHGHYIMGPEIGELELKLSAFTGAAHCITCSSGSDALLLPLMAWGADKDAMVFLPAFTFFATAEMPALLGTKITFVDIEPTTFNMAPDALEAAIEAQKKTVSWDKGFVIPVDLFGQLCQYERLLPIAENYGLQTLEDAAQAFGSAQSGHMACNMGCNAAATSFFPAKPLGCYGDGGAIFTNDDQLAAKLRSLRVHGHGTNKYDNVHIGLNGRMDTIQAAILLVKIRIFPEEISRRRQVAKLYSHYLEMLAEVVVPQVATGNASVWAQYCILLPEPKRDKVAEALKNAGVPVNIYYPRILPALEVFKCKKLKEEDFPVASQISRRILALPCHPYLDEKEIKYIAGVIEKALQS